MADRIVRITRVWDVTVTADYGDDDQTLLEKASPSTLANASETKNLLPEDGA